MSDGKEKLASLSQFFISGRLGFLAVGESTWNEVRTNLGSPDDSFGGSTDAGAPERFVFGKLELDFFSGQEGGITSHLQAIIFCSNPFGEWCAHEINCGDRYWVDSCGFFVHMSKERFCDQAARTNVPFRWFRSKIHPVDDVLYAKTIGGVYIQFASGGQGDEHTLLTMHRTLEDAWWSDLVPLDV